MESAIGAVRVRVNTNGWTLTAVDCLLLVQKRQFYRSDQILKLQHIWCYLQNISTHSTSILNLYEQIQAVRLLLKSHLLPRVKTLGWHKVKKKPTRLKLPASPPPSNTRSN